MLPTSLARLRLGAATLALLLSSACGSSTAPDEQVITLHVAPERVPCVGVGPQECMQVRERADEPWSLFYGGIAGFSHEQGYHYTLRVARRHVPDPPADGSSLAYRLVSVVARVPA